VLTFGYHLPWNPDELASFAVCQAFPCSDYSDASDSPAFHRVTATLPAGASPVHRDGLDEIP